VEIEQIPNPSKAIEALLAGSADLVAGNFEAVLLLAADGQKLQSIMNIVARDIRGVVALPDKNVRSLRDLRRRNVGVSGLGSATHTFLKHVLIQNGIQPDDVSMAGIGMGRSGIVALERGLVEAASVAAGDLLHLKHKYPQLVVLADSSTPHGSTAIYGSEALPTVSLLCRPAWLETHPTEVRKIVRAIQQSLQWLHDNTPAEIRGRMPAAALTGDVAEDLAAIAAMKGFWSSNGLMPAAGPETVRKALAVTQEKIRVAQIDLAKTFTNQYVWEGQ
jgi:NitT/TauT family transport system substrate-binding protein